jgi:predicted Fe-Mo cluster-binding NifX family protein
MMRIAIPTFMTRVSPRFDCASTVLLLTIDNGQIESREALAADGWTAATRVKRLVELGIDCVICGGIDVRSAESLRSAGITVRGGITGEIADALADLVDGKVTSTDYLSDRGKTDIAS